MSPRLACNLIYIHLRNRQQHTEKCNERRCAADCGIEQLHARLDAPLLSADFRAEQRRHERMAALRRGEIPS